ncbi:hypothetical protein EVAR_101825_1 [Eumeta japonica]|uniref:Uncharacterized protein n=1 Tax=Eumeta variegata TaxID=151549 RepID=A0A4C1SQK1_EUMVA|nr:hypothetical protein EVAR_101825_1 [Eumeta japonica]
MEINTSCPKGAGEVPKGPVTRALIKDIVLKSLSEMGCECPESELEKFVRTATPVASRAATPASSANSSRSHSPAKGKKKGKRSASSSSEEQTTDSGSTSSAQTTSLVPSPTHGTLWGFSLCQREEQKGSPQNGQEN